MTSSEKQVPKTKVCCACKVEKQIKYFYKNNYVSAGYDGRCKLCKRKNILCKKKKSVGRSKIRKEDAPSLWNVRKQDWIETYKFLESMGYDLSKNIHEQFCLKHNLNPRNRMKEKSIQYSPEDLGLI